METVTDDITAKADTVLKSSFPGAVTEWDEPTEDGRASGWVIWDGFAGTDPVDRQLAVAEAIRIGLGAERWSYFAAIFAMTPDELDAMDG